MCDGELMPEEQRDVLNLLIVQRSETARNYAEFVQQCGVAFNRRAAEQRQNLARGTNLPVGARPWKDVKRFLQP